MIIQHNSRNASPCTSLQSYGLTNMEDTEENGNSFTSRDIAVVSLLESIHMFHLFHVHGSEQDSCKLGG